MNYSLWFLNFALVIVALIHLIPVTGVLSAERLFSLYGVRPTSPDMLLLLRHRALLFALVGGVLLAGAFFPELRLTAIAMGMASMLGFLLLFALTDDPGPALRRVFYVDVFASLLLAAGAVVKYVVRF
ncbi:MAG: phosphopantetheine adenylyltransferase [bacterium]|nr:phosphopantetheine adenylyltransferase [bacterium]